MYINIILLCLCFVEPTGYQAGLAYTSSADCDRNYEDKESAEYRNLRGEVELEVFIFQPVSLSFRALFKNRKSSLYVMAVHSLYAICSE